jgi:hypothetical protein
VAGIVFSSRSPRIISCGGSELDHELHIWGVTGDLRRDIFRHLTSHAPSYFSDRLPGMRQTASRDLGRGFGQNMFVWNVLPPCMVTVTAIALMEP